MKLTLNFIFLLFTHQVICQITEVESIRKTSDLDSILISANRISIPFSEDSRSISIITNKQIERLDPTDINDLLQVVAGVDVRQRGAQGVQADVSIRGGTFEQTLVLINGIRMSDPQTGHHMMNLPLSVEDIERIEIIKGPAARMYGQNAFSGAINIVTKVQSDFGATFKAGFGENSLGLVYLNLSAPIGKYKQSISGSYRSSEGYRFNTDFIIRNLFYQSQIDVKDGEIRFLAGYVDRDFGANGFYGNETFINQYETVQTWVANVSAKKQYGNLIIMPKISYRSNNDNWQFLREDPELFQNFHESGVLTTEVQSTLLHSLGALGIGVEHNYLTLESTNLKDQSGNGDHLRNQFGAHIENRFVLADGKLDVTPGILALYITDREELNFFPGLDVGYSLGEKFKIFANAGWTTRIPTFTDLYYQDAGNSGNPDLLPERAFTYEVGLKYKYENRHVQLSYFDRKATDQIDWFRQTEDDKWMPDNFSVATYKGFDASYQRAFASNYFIDFISISYTYLNANFEENDFAFSRNQLENLRHQLVIQPQFSVKNFKFSVLFKYNDRVSLDDYYTFNTNFSYQYKRQKFFLRASNLTGQIYKETNLVEMPGRWVSGGVEMKLGSL